MSRADTFVTNAETVNRRLPPNATLHLARSCFAMLLRDAHTQAIAEGVSHEVFRQEIGAAIDELNMPIFHEVDADRHLPGKRQPSLRESFDATLDRYSSIDRLQDVFGGAAGALVYGGSMKYGPFMNVRGGGDASDIDAIIVTDRTMLDELDWRGVMETTLFEERDKLAFFARHGLQRALVEQGLIDITSQRFTIANAGYTMSAHLVSSDFVAHAYPQAMGDIVECDHHKYVRDYKERPFERTHVSNFGMSGDAHDIPVYNAAVAGGFIAANPAYSVVGGRYVPGMYQNLVLPKPCYAFGENSSTVLPIRAFVETMRQREALERRHDRSASINNTEPRKPIIAHDVSDILYS